MTTPLPVFDTGYPFKDACPDILSRVRVAALALNRARHGDAVDYNRKTAQRSAEWIAAHLQRYLGTRVSLSACLALAAFLIEEKAREWDPQAAV
jgi:hypothetical protein